MKHFSFGRAVRLCIFSIGKSQPLGRGNQVLGPIPFNVAFIITSLVEMNSILTAWYFIKPVHHKRVQKLTMCSQTTRFNCYAVESEEFFFFYSNSAF